MEKLLDQLGLVTSSSRIYDFIKNFIFRNRHASFSDLLEGLSSFLDVHNSESKARKILVFLREQKMLKLEDGKMSISEKLKNYQGKKRAGHYTVNPSAGFRTKPLILKESGIIVEQSGNRYKLYDDGRIGMFP